MPPTEWKEWSNFVLAELKRLSEQNGNINTSVNTIQIEIGKLKVKSSIWGVIGGMIPMSILILTQIIIAWKK